MKTKPPKVTRAQLERKILEATAQQASATYFASTNLDRVSIECLMGSGVLLQLSFMGGEEVFRPVVIRDGLSKETIDSIKRDLKRSYDLATQFAL